MTMPPSIFTVTNETQLYAREERGVSGQEENWKKWRNCCNSVFFCFFFFFKFVLDSDRSGKYHCISNSQRCYLFIHKRTYFKAVVV